MSTPTSRFGAVASAVYPPTSAPSGCSPNFSGTFEITIVNATTSSKRNLQERQKAGVLTITLNNSILHDQAGRTGYIASNDQFQFDAPPQAGAIYTAGFSLCPNGSLALGDSAIWYQCLSGTFYNLYDISQGGQCGPVYIDAINENGTSVPVTTTSSLLSSPSSASFSNATSSATVSSAVVVPTTTTIRPTSSTPSSSGLPSSTTTSSSAPSSTAVTTSPASSSASAVASSSASAASSAAASSSSAATSKTVTIAGVMKLIVTLGMITSLLSW